MPSYFTLRMQFGPHEDPEEIKRQLLDLVKQAPVDEIMFFYFAEEQNDGHDTHERIRQWIERSRPYRQALAEAGVKVSLNPWHSLLHYDGYRKRKPGQDWQGMVDPNGREAEAVVCPLDHKWQAYFAQTLEWYAQEGFRVIWIDDDIRYHNHSPLEWGGCFCPLHVAEFNRRAGTQATREQIVAACTAPGKPHPWRAIWLDMWQETLLDLIARWRDIVQARGVELGLMSSAPEWHGSEGRRWAGWWKAFGGNKPPVHRPHFWGYSDAAGGSLANYIAVLDQNRVLQPAELESGPEIENFPYGAWNKSFRQTGAQMALAHILGSTNLNISLYDFMGKRPDDEPERAAFLRRWRPICDWLADLFPMTLRPVGVGLPWSEEMGRKMRTDGSGKWDSLVCPSRGWANWLGAAGHAFSMRPSPVVNALSGPMAWSLTDDQLRGWLSKSVLLDGLAAGILVERGMSEWIGVKSGRLITQQDRLYSVEHCLDGEFALREGAEMSLNRHRYAERLFQGELLPGARAVSDLRGPTQDIVGHGLFVYENRLGGRVAVVPWAADADLKMNAQRAAQLSKTLAWLDPAGAHGLASGGAWLVPQFLTDGKAWRGVIWNASADEVSEITLRLPAGMPRPASAIQVNARGERRPARMEGNRLVLAQPMYQWEFVVLS